MYDILSTLTAISSVAFMMGIIVYTCSSDYDKNFHGSKGFETFIASLVLSFAFMLLIDIYTAALYGVYYIFSR